MSIITGLHGFSNGKYFNNAPRAFTPVEPYGAGTAKYYEDKVKLYESYSGLAPASLQNTVFDASHFQNFDINYSIHDSVFASQLNEWQALQQNLTATDKQARHLISYDFETIGVRNARAFDINTGALTEFGFTDTIVRNGKAGKSSSYSVAFGISQEQGANFLKDIADFDGGLSGIAKSEAGSIESTVERLSRYAGNINDLFDSVNVGRFKDVVVINKLSPSSVANINQALDGLMNLSVLGGMDSSRFRTMIKDSGLFKDHDEAVSRFIAKKELFEESGFGTQIANKESKLLNGLKSMITGYIDKPNTHVLGYNINAFDNPIFNAIGNTEIKIDNSRVLDVYSAFSALGNGREIGIAEAIAGQHGYDSVNFGKKVKEEGLAHALGLVFGDVAHNAASDTAIVNEIVLTKDFLDGASLFGNITPKTRQGLDLFGDNTVGLALTSMHYDKDGKDLMMISNNGKDFQVANEFYMSGVNRNRYYHIDGVLDNNGDGVLVQMTSAASGTKQRLFKHFVSLEEANEALRKHFVFEDKTSFGPDESAIQSYIDRQDMAYKGDAARREYERLFGTDSISVYYDKKTDSRKLQGGYDRLNQYYQAYQESAIKFREHYGLQAGEALSEQQLKEIAMSDMFDKDITTALVNAGVGYGDNNDTIAPSTLRDMKHLIGKFQDEASMFESLQANFKDTQMDNYQKTMVAGRLREKIFGAPGVLPKEVEYTDRKGFFGVTDNFTFARRQDLFSITVPGNINKGGEVILPTINFENERHATSQLYNTVMNHARSQKSGNVNDSAMRLMSNMVYRLHEDGYVSRDFFDSFSKSFNQNQTMNYQPWRYAEWIVNEVRTGYVQPLQNIGFDLTKLQNFGDGQTDDLYALGEKFSGLKAEHLPEAFRNTIAKKYANDISTNGWTLDQAVRRHFADLTLHKMSDYSGLYESKAFGTKFTQGEFDTVYKSVFQGDTVNTFIQDQIKDTNGIIYGITSKDAANNAEATVYAIQEKTKQLLGYDDATANEVGRMFSYKTKNGQPFGLLTYGGTNHGDKTDFITTFFHTGVAGDNGFILINDSNDISGYNKMLNKLSTATHENYADVISEITEQRFAGVFKLAAIHDHSEIFKINNADGSMSPLFGGRVGLDGKAVPFEFKTMDYGDKGFQKIVRQTVNSYRQKVAGETSYALKDLVMQATDDAFEINKWYASTRYSMAEIMQNESLTLGERYKQVTDLVRKYQNRVVKDDVMPGLSGASTVLRIGGEYKKVQLPNMADILQSQKINVSALKDLFVQTVADGVSGRGPQIENDLKMANFIAQFVPKKDSETASAVIQRVAKEVATNRDYSFGAEFEEAFAKHLFALNIENAEGYSKSAALPTGTIIDYLHDASKKGKYHESTTKLVQMLHANNKVGNISQILKEHDIEQGYVSLIDPMLFVPHSHMDSTMRPVSVQQLTAGSYVIDEVREELGSDYIKRMNINLGYDSPSYQLEVLRKSLKDNFGVISGTELKDKNGVIIKGSGKTFGDLGQGISANFRNIGSAEGMVLIKEGEKKLGDLATTNYQEIAAKISKYGVSDAKVSEINERLTREAYNLLAKNAAYNTWESKGFLNPMFANNSYFTAPSLRRFDLSGTVSDTQAKELANLIVEKNVQVHNGFNLSTFYKKHAGRDLVVTDDIGGTVPLIYHGPKGTMVGTDDIFGSKDDLIHTLTTGTGYVKEYKQGMMDAKVILGNEKMTVRILEFDKGLKIKDDNIYGAMRSILNEHGITKAKDQWGIIRQYAGNAFESIFGEGVAGVVNLPLDKHINATASNYMNYILNFATQSLTGNEKYDKTIFERYDKLFNEARRILVDDKGEFQYSSNFMGIQLKTVGEGKNKRFTYDTSMLGKEGAVEQIEQVVDLIMQDERKYFDPLRKQLQRSAEEQIYRGTMVLGINQEAKGGELYMDSRMAISLRSKGTENFEGEIIPFRGSGNLNFNAILNGKGDATLVNDYIYDRMKQEALEGIAGDKYDSAAMSIRGMYNSLNAYGKGGSYAQSNILELQLDDIVIAPTGYNESIEDYMRYGIFKFVEEDKKGKGKIKYSKELQKIADKQGINLDKVTMLKINLTDGLTYDWKTADGKTKQMSSIFMPIMDVSPYGDDVYLTGTQRNMMRVLNTAKTFREEGVTATREKLSTQVEQMMINFQHELTSKKDSYFSKRLMRFEMKNSGLLFAEHTKVPVLNAAVKKRDKWLGDEEFRENLIEAVRTGKDIRGAVSWDDIKMAEDSFNSASFSRKVKGVMRYDDIIEMGREGFEAKGVNFRTAGLDILANTKNYSDMAKLAVDHKKLLEVEQALQDKVNNLDDIARKMNLKDIQSAKDVINALNSHKRFKGRSQLEKATKETFEQVTEIYLENIGTFGLVGRYPTFQEGSLSYVISRLNKKLSRDEITVTPMLAQRLNMDHDGDNGILKLFMEDGKLLNNVSEDGKGNLLFKSIAKQYNEYLESGANNEIFADMLSDISDQIKKNGGREVDIISALHGTDRVYARAKTLQKTLTQRNKTDFINELKQSDFEFGSITLETPEDIDALLKTKGDNVYFNTDKQRYEFTDDAQTLINKLYTYQQKTGGNFLKSEFMKASSIKARATKYEIGFISNPNYYINQTMNEMFTRYVDGIGTGDITQEQLDKFLDIKTILHKDNIGFLPVTEQSSIDTKHIVAGLSISETPKYSAGIKSIFNVVGDKTKTEANQRQGLIKLYNALKFNDKALDRSIYSDANTFANTILKGTLNEFIENEDSTGQMFRALIDLANLANETERKNITGKMSTLANNVTDVYDFLNDVNGALANYKNGNMIAKRTTGGLLMSELAKDVDGFKRAWYSNNGILQELNHESVYFEKVAEGTGGFFRPRAVTFEGFDVDDNGIYTLNFKEYSKKKKDVTQITGTASQVHAQLRQRFGAFESVSKGEATLLLSANRKGNINASGNYRNRIAEANAMEYLQLRAEHELLGKSFTAQDYIAGAWSGGRGKRKPLGLKETEQLLANIDNAFEGKKNKAYLELRNNLRYIKSSNPMTRYSDVLSQAMPFDDTLQELNRRIVKSAKGKKTSTSVDKIFEEFYKNISGDDNILDSFSGSTYKQFLKNQKGYDFTNFFDEFDDQRFDMRAAYKDLTANTTLDMDGDPVMASIQNKLDKYAMQNQKIEYQAREMMDKFETKQDVQDMFHWYGKKAGEFRVGFDDGTGQWLGRKFNSLSQEDIDRILYYTPDTLSKLDKYRVNETKDRLANYAASTKRFRTSPLQGATEQDITDINNMLAGLNRDTIDKAAEAGERAAEREAQKEGLQEIANNMIMDKKALGDTWNKVKDFAGNHKKQLGYAGLALGALGLVNGLMNSNDSPLAPTELKAKPRTGTVGRGKGAPKTPNTVYANPTDGLNYKMSASSVKKINNTQAAGQLGTIAGGSTNVNVRDERKPVSDSWLQEKFSDYV
jgi:hypothetical protein